MAVLNEFLSNISRILETQDAAGLKQHLCIEPPLPDSFLNLQQELRASFSDDKVLERYVEHHVPINHDVAPGEGSAWNGFLEFLRAFLEYLRDVNFDNLLDTHTKLRVLSGRSTAALSDATFGNIMLPTTLLLCSTLVRLTVVLEKSPDITRALRQLKKSSQDEERKTLAETIAEFMNNELLGKCCNDRTLTSIEDGGKKAGTYIAANLALKMFHQCRSSKHTDKIIRSVAHSTSPLSRYPASQRVTYLYYLGVFHFRNTHFYAAQLCLQSAYDQCLRQSFKHRRLILIYLISTNIILGRFPSQYLLARPEASDLAAKFLPICQAIKQGNMIAFKQAFTLYEKWFFQFGIYLPLMSRCQVLVWRSLARRTFLLTYQVPSDPNSRKAPTLNLEHLVAAAQYCQKVMEGWQRPNDAMTEMQSGRQHMNSMFMKAPDLVPPAGGPKRLKPHQGMVLGNKWPDLIEVEAVVASLTEQGFLHGFISHNQIKFAILGAKQRGGALQAGFPVPWDVIKARAESENRAKDVPGWLVKPTPRTGGVVHNLSGIARPVGSA